MILNKHFDLEGRHARLSASNYHWTNYDQDKLVDTWHNQREAVMSDFEKRPPTYIDPR